MKRITKTEYRLLNKMLLVCTILLSLVGCTDQKKEEMETVEIYKGTYFDLIPSEKTAELRDKNIYCKDEEFVLLGNDLSSWNFTTINEEKISLPDQGPYILEIIGSHCIHCRNLAKGVIDSSFYKDVPVYQYFPDEDSNEIRSFYAEMEKEIPEQITVLMKNDAFKAFLEENNLTSTPLSFFIDENGKVVLCHLGHSNMDNYIALYDFAVHSGINYIEVDGMKLSEFISRQEKIRSYIDNLTQIEVPSSLFD